MPDENGKNSVEENEGITEPVTSVEPENAAAETGDDSPEETSGQPEEQPESDLELRLRQVSAAYVKLQEEMQSFRERNERIQQERDRRRQGEVVMAMFEPVQNLRRSLEAWGQLDLPLEATQGLGLVFEQFQSALRKLGLEEIATAPAPFDPNIHDAICAMPVTKASLDGQVIQVFEAGYRVGSQVIQAARVVIGRYEEPVTEATEAEPSEAEQGEE